MTKVERPFAFRCHHDWAPGNDASWQRPSWPHPVSAFHDCPALGLTAPGLRRAGSASCRVCAAPCLSVPGLRRAGSASCRVCVAPCLSVPGLRRAVSERAGSASCRGCAKSWLCQDVAVPCRGCAKPWLRRAVTAPSPPGRVTSSPPTPLTRCVSSRAPSHLCSKVRRMSAKDLLRRLTWPWRQPASLTGDPSRSTCESDGIRGQALWMTWAEMMRHDPHSSTRLVAKDVVPCDSSLAIRRSSCVLRLQSLYVPQLPIYGPPSAARDLPANVVDNTMWVTVSPWRPSRVAMSSSRATVSTWTTRIRATAPAT